MDKQAFRWRWAALMLLVVGFLSRPAAAASEDFTATVNGSWPQQWTAGALSGSPSFIVSSAIYGSDGSVGRMSGAPIHTGGVQYLMGPGRQDNSDQTVRIAVSDSTPDGGLIARLNDSGFYYGCLVGSTDRLRIFKVTSAGYAALTPSTSTPRLTNNSWYWLRMKITRNGDFSTIQAALWQGDPNQPPAWSVEVTDSEPLLRFPGYEGITASAGSSSNKYFYFDQYRSVEQLRLWSSASTWAGSVPPVVPGPTTNVMVPTGSPVRLDVPLAHVASVTIPEGATLEFDPGNSIKLESDGNVVVRGTLRMKPATPQQRHKLSITHAIESLFQGTLNPDAMEVQANDTGVWVLGLGLLDLEGSHKTSWTRANTATDLHSGDSWIDLAAGDLSGWRADDEIVITPTAAAAARNDPIYQSEVRKVDHVEQNGSAWRVYLKYQPFLIPNVDCAENDSCSNQMAPPGVPNPPANGALLFNHPVARIGTVMAQSAEVLNLTRNVIIEGKAQAPWFPRGSLASQPQVPGRTHILIHNDAPVVQNIKYVTLRYMGPRQPDPGEPNANSNFVKGRYALHFHHCMELSSGTRVEGVVVRDSGSHAFVPHASDGITFADTISYNTVDDAYWWDPVSPLGSTDPMAVMNGTTNEVTYSRAVAALVNADGPSQRNTLLTGFLLGVGQGNRILDSVAVSILTLGRSSGFHWPEAANFKDNLWQVSGIVVHNNVSDGVFVWQNDGHFHLIENLVAYHNWKTGIEQGAYVNSYHYDGGFLYENGGNAPAGGAEAQILLNASSLSGNPIEFSNMTIDAAGRTARIVSIFDVRTGASTVPTRFRNMQTRGNTGAVVALNLQPVTVPNPAYSVDFINWTRLDAGQSLNLVTDVVTNLFFGSPTNSVLRTQQGLSTGGPCTAQQVTSSNSTPQSISCFFPSP